MIDILFTVDEIYLLSTCHEFEANIGLSGTFVFTREMTAMETLLFVPRKG